MQPFQLLFVFCRSPQEFFDRVTMIAEVRRENARKDRPVYPALDESEGLAALGNSIGIQVGPFLKESSLLEIEATLEEGRARIPSGAPFRTTHNGDPMLGRVCYSVVRALRPAVVIETGVCYGVTSSYLLQALHVNGAGHLHSIDLPPLGKDGDRFVGFLVPQELKASWSLYRGTSRRLLPEILTKVAKADLFIHDSLHTRDNMRREFETVWPALRPGGVLIADDIHRNCAFLEMQKHPEVTSSAIIKERDKVSDLGIVVKKQAGVTSVQ
jgi:predicted O-methyltransferase YrrM